MKLAIIGSRNFTDFDKLKSIFKELFGENSEFFQDITIVSGGCPKGADALAVRLCALYDLPYEEYPADWDTYGKSAGPRRNTTIVQNSDMVIACWDGRSNGTRDVINKTNKFKKPCLIIWM